MSQRGLSGKKKEPINIIPESLINDDLLKMMQTNRYKNWDQKLGNDIQQGRHSLDTLSDYVRNMSIVDSTPSDKQELFENIFMRAVYK